MYFNFTLILTLLVFLTLGLWLVARFVLQPRRQQRLAAGHDDVPKVWQIIEYIGSFFPVLLFVWLLRSFLYEPFRIPSGSMIPTLTVGDFIVVNKYAYGVRLPVINTKVIDVGQPQRGDVVVFRYPLDESMNYIKRLVGLPGDRITYRNKTLFINGEQVEHKTNGYYGEDTGGCYAPSIPSQIRIEKLGEAEHELLVNASRARAREQSWVVPDGHYFMMGDNRDCSQDSRYWGFVPEQNLVGKAKFIWFHWLEFDRIGDKIN
ncbi:MAG: signal peptidase I [Gammaproteobacteria bacterium]|jgi:signal peptidase I|nr:signal peptidase I [Gammaproteobacteria bacterium]